MVNKFTEYEFGEEELPSNCVESEEREKPLDYKRVQYIVVSQK